MGRFNFAMPDDLKKALKEKADEKHISLGAYIRLVLSAELAK